MKDLAEAYRRARRASERLCEPLAVEDHVVQPIDDVSPPKWHLGHTTWFFETFLLEPRERGYAPHDAAYPAVFNSYYRTVGSPYPRAKRGTLSRPTVKEVRAYRRAVDGRLLELLGRRDAARDAALARALELGINHEQQHQELLLADIKFILAHNPVPASYAGGGFAGPPAPRRRGAAALRRLPFSGGRFRLGHAGEGFAFDNEGPVHEVVVGPFRLAHRPATNAEYARFMEEGGYRDFRHWLSDGWDRAQAEGWTAPLHWSEGLDPAAPACHLSYYEADAFARWAGARLPTEAEWEFAAAAQRADPRDGNFLEDGRWRPLPAVETGEAGRLLQLYGDVWEWTSSAYGPYPGFRPDRGAFGEYNGKFMSGQFVLRGGSCATPRGHVRRTYRNFFQPEKRWQFTGVRLAWDA